MLFHQLSEHLVLALQFDLQEGDALVASLELLVGRGEGSKAAAPLSKNCLSHRYKTVGFS